ncbi:OmpA family protein [Spirosoma endophyticum]|uniref:Outer membrane protein OmpA n=1 Tax=Spirosoma endophyticum TaxID=662367 RepID=A0A1I1VY59_9BACT|nr:OmpA family protein [Spirosoma endophyticum]SFD87699.1 Outer membrane protein OmpA [Spirosoma endophyticum]
MNYQLKSAGTKPLAMLLVAGILSGNVLTSCKSSAQAVNQTPKDKTSKSKLSKSQKGAIVGASGGAVIGAVLGQGKGNTALGAILGATVGGAGGAIIGRRMDKQAEEIKRQMPTAQVERVGEGIKISLGSDILFDVDSYALKPETKKQLIEFAQTLNKYEDTDIRIEGHADATGPEDHNLKLSKQRATTVGNFLETQGVRTSRVDEKGYGEVQPVADNTTEAGRRKNRRVDIAVFANKKMQQDAKDGKLGD